MADLSSIKAEINSNIVTNGTNAITADKLNTILNDMCDDVESALTTTETTTQASVDDTRFYLDELNLEVGTMVRTFTMPSGNHSSSADKIGVVVASGDKFSVKLERAQVGSSNTYTLYVFDSGGNATQISGGKTFGVAYNITAPTDIEWIGFYISSTAGVAYDTMTATISLPTSHETRITALETDVATLDDINFTAQKSAQQLNGMTASYAGGSSGNKKISCIICAGLTYKVTNTSSSGSFTFYTYDADGTKVETISSSNITKGSTRTFTATLNASQVGGYMSASTCTFTIELVDAAIVPVIEDVNSKMSAMEFNTISSNDSASIAVGTIYQGNVSSSTSSLYDVNYYSVIGGQVLTFTHIDGVTIRLTEYDADKTYIKQAGYADLASLELSASCRYVRIAGNYTALGYDSNNPISLADYNSGDFYFTYDSLEITSKMDDYLSSVYQLNKEKEPAVASLGNYFTTSYSTAHRNIFPLFVVVTDIHSDWTRLKRAQDYAVAIGAEAIFCLGDIGDNQGQFDAFDWDSFVLSTDIPVLTIAGNHEFIYNSGQSTYTGYTDATFYNKVFNATMVTHNGETHPTGMNYWYKDITTNVVGTSYKLRIIGLYQYEYEDTWTDGHPDHEQDSGYGKDTPYYKQAQIDWLVNLLDGVDSSTHVLILCHYAPTNNMTRVDNDWNPSAALGLNLTKGISNNSNNDLIPQIVQAWIDGTTINASCTMSIDSSVVSVSHTFGSSHTGKFAGYVNGHNHFFALTKIVDTDQYNYKINTTSDKDSLQQSDLPRAASGKAQDSFAVMSYNYVSGAVKMIAVGSDVTQDMRDKKYLYNK